MLLDRLIPDAAQRNITILATDINPRFLRKAAEGIYGESSFRETPPWIRERYFNRRKDGRFEIKPHTRKMVTFPTSISPGTFIHRCGTTPTRWT